MKKNLPHYGVLVYLKPSKIEGIGVFAVDDIKKGSEIFSRDKDLGKSISIREVNKLKTHIKRLYERYCPIENGRYSCPRHFDTITPLWFLNHSKKPNIHRTDDQKFWANRNIKKNEELTIDYDTLDT